MAAKTRRISIVSMTKLPKAPRFQIKDKVRRAKAELNRLKAEVAREKKSSTSNFNFTPTFSVGAFNFNAPVEPMEVSEPSLKRDHDTANGVKPEAGGELKKLTILNKRLASQSVISAAALNDLELLTEQVTKAKNSDTYCKTRLATELNCALMQAVTGKSPPMVRALLDWGADPTSFKNWYSVCLSAIDVDCEEIVDILLEKGISFTVSCPYGTPLHSAAKTGNISILKKLLALNVLDINSKNDIQGATPLHTATLLNRKEAVELLLQHGAMVNATDESKRTPLHHASSRGSTDIAELLINHGGDIHAVDSESKTPWMCASVSMHSALADKLIAQIDNIKGLRFLDGATSLHLAAAAGLTQCVEFLLTSGLDIGAKDNYGNTPLLKAVINGRSHIVRLLLKTGKNGALVNHKNNDDNSALACALKHPFNTVSKMMLTRLVEGGADVNAVCKGKTLIMHALTDSFEKVEWLTENGANLNTVLENQNTLLMEAVNQVRFSSALYAVSFLLDRNIDLRISSRMYEGYTPLTFALKRGHVELASLLFHSGASLNGVSHWLKTDEAKTEEERSDELRALCNIIRQRIPHCLNLQNMSRLAVLGSLGHFNIKQKIQPLELPTLVKAYMHLDNYKKLSLYESNC